MRFGTAAASDDDDQGPWPATPRSELARLREAQAQASSELRETIMEAMLATCGRVGYRKTSVHAVLETYGGNRTQFYRHFAGKEDCYAAAYEAESARLCGTLLDVAKGGSWRAGLNAALAELARFAIARTDVAKGLLIEVNAVGGRALAVREAVIEHFVRAVDTARREVVPLEPPPSITAIFMVSALESSLCAALADGAPERFAEAVPELSQMVAAAYFGDEMSDETLAELSTC